MINEIKHLYCAFLRAFGDDIDDPEFRSKWTSLLRAVDVDPYKSDVTYDFWKRFALVDDNNSRAMDIIIPIERRS